MNSMKPQYLNQISYREEHLKTIGALRQQKGEQERFTYQTPEMLETLRTAAMIESAESSNRLEGITAERARIEALALHSTNPANRPEQEIAGYNTTAQHFGRAASTSLNSMITQLKRIPPKED